MTAHFSRLEVRSILVPESLSHLKVDNRLNVSLRNVLKKTEFLVKNVIKKSIIDLMNDNGLDGP